MPFDLQDEWKGTPDSRVTFGTRRSRLAMWQTNKVIEAVCRRFPGLECDTAAVDTTGDGSLTAIPALDTVGVFTRELEVALHGLDIDAAVHSLKDLPTTHPNGLTLGAICVRDDVRDVLVSNGVLFDNLPSGARVGTSSPRRAAQVRALRPDLRPVPIRGNVETRLQKVRNGEFDAAVMAAAGLRRLGLESEITEYFAVDRFVPAPGQGALAVQCRSGDTRILSLLAAIDEPAVRAAATAERAFLSALQGGCTAPVGAHAVTAGRDLLLVGVVLAGDGSRKIDVTRRGPLTAPDALGREAAEQVIQRGARTLMPC